MSEKPFVGDVGERRQHVRVPVRWEAVFQTGEEVISCYMFNVGQGGLFIHTQNPLPINEDVLLSFRLPRIDRVFEARGRVIWSTPPGGKAVSGMGIAFYQISPDDLGVLEKFIAAELAK